MTGMPKMKSDLRKGRITRRDFMQGAAAMGIAATAVPGLMSQAYAAAPKKGGHFKIGIDADTTTDSLDPGTYSGTYAQTFGYARNNHLTEINEEGHAVPELAESIESSPDAKVWTVKLRKGVEFHNGKTMDADDVIASYNHHRGQDNTSRASGVVEVIADIKADGKDTVVFTLSGGIADFPFIMADYHIPIMPGKDGTLIDATSGISTGAYAIDSFEPGIKAVVKKNPNFWKDAGHFDSAEILAIKDVVARTNALTSGEIHAIDRVDLNTAHLLKRNKNLTVRQTTGTQHYSIPMVTTKPPYNDVNVRQALKYAVDRNALVNTILRGYGKVANDHPISPANPYFNTDLEQTRYDPDKAKFHMKKAGLTSLSVDLSTADAAFGGAIDAAVLYQEHAAKAGIDINIVREPNDGYWSNVWMKKDWCMSYWAGRPTEDWMFSIAYAKGANWNETFWEHERFNTLLLAARVELDTEKRREMYWELQSIVRSDGGAVVPMYASYVFATSNDIKVSDKMAANGDLDGNKALERWSFA